MPPQLDSVRKTRAKAAGRSLGYGDLVAKLRREIESGRLAEGDRLPSFLDLQNKYGTTSNTINRALIELEKEGLIVRERWRGVFVAPRRVERRQAIGLADFDSVATISPYYSLLVRGIQSVAHREQYEITLINTQSRGGVDKVDGVVGHGETGAEFLESLPSGLPVVNVMAPMENGLAVAVDDFGGAAKATEYLLGLGHKRIGFLGYVEAPSTRRRLGGYRAALEAAGIEPASGWIHPLRLRLNEKISTTDVRDRVKEFGHLNALEWLRGDWPEENLTAIIAQNDELAIGMMQALREEGYEVPRDVSVMGFDSTALCEMCSPRLTSVHLPLEQIGAMAAELLLRRIREEKIDTMTSVVPMDVDIRESTAPPRQEE